MARQAAEEHRKARESERGLAELRASGAIVTCKLTRYEGERTLEAWQCRVSGFVPSPAPGRKAKAA